MGSSYRTLTETTSHKENHKMAPVMVTGYEEEAMSKTHNYRKVVKPLIERKRRARKLLPGRAERPDGVCPADGGGEHLQAGEGGRAGADSEPLEEVEEAADVELEPSPRPGQVPCRLHHLRHRSEPQPCLLWGRHLHRLKADGPPWAQAQHHRELKGRPPQRQGA